MANTTTRRAAMKTGLASAAAAIVAPGLKAATPEEIGPKKAGETKIVFLGGDYLHNFAAQEPAVRRAGERMGGSVYSAHDARYITPEFIRDADLLIIQRWDGTVPGWTPGPIMTEAPIPNDGFLNDAFGDAVIDNVKNRGMGFMSLHCTLTMSWKAPKYIDFLGIYGIIHGPLQKVRVHNLNQDHPITRGIPEFDIGLDENFGAEIRVPGVTRLYETTGYLDKRHDVGAWCRDCGAGRVAGLLGGHTYFAYEDPNYLKMLSRSMYWTLKRDIPRNG